MTATGPADFEPPYLRPDCPARRGSLVARDEGGGVPGCDGRPQGEEETVFVAL